MFDFKKKKNVKIPDSELSEDELFLRKLEKKKKRNKWIKIGVGVVVVALFLFIIFNVFFGSAVGTKFDYSKVYKTKPAQALESVDPEAGMTLFADNGILRMEYSPVDDLFIFTDVKSGKQFRSWPEPAEDEIFVPRNEKEEKDEEKYNYPRYSTNHNIISSPVFVGHTNSGLDGGFVLGVNQFKTFTKKVNKIENGVQLYYDIDDIKASFYVEFVIEDNAIVMNFPSEGIKEKKAGKGENQDRMPRLSSISGLLYLNTARQGDNGYYVLPDGSGALTYFDAARVSSYDEYEKTVYGSDMTFDSLSSPDFNNISLNMPVFGMIKDNVMIYSFATEGETAAAIQMGNPGVRGIPYYSIGFKYQLRRFYYTQTSKNISSFLQLETEFSVKSVQQKTYIVVGDEDQKFTYVDIANKTRDFLLEKWGGKELAESAAAMNIKIFLGAENTTGSVFKGVKVMTTFDEVKEIYSALEEKGVKDVRLALLGWQKNGYYGIATSKYSVEKDLGGNKGLSSLASWADEKGIQLSLENNTIMLYGAPSSGNSLRYSVIKEPGTSYLKFKVVSNAGVFRTGTDYYVLSPAYYQSKFLSKDLKKMSDLGIKSVDLQTVGDTLMTDYNKKNAALRSQVVDYYQGWIDSFGDKLGSVSVYYGNEYAVAGADYLLDAPLYSSTSLVLDESIPFMQIVYHGLIDYYSEPINKADDMDVLKLKAIEYGALFSYELTYNSTEQLKYTMYNTLFRSEYTDLVDDIDEVNEISEQIKSLRSERIVNHYRPVEGVEAFCTEYSDGTKVYVNYTKADVTSGDVTIPAQDYVIK